MQVIRLSGDEIQRYIPDLAALRIKIFHDYPYLYEGDLEYEKKYLQTYTRCPYSVLVLALDDSKVVGASTAIPLQYETEEIRNPFLVANMNVDRIFYFGESVLLHAYRGQKIGERFFAERESAAREQGYSVAAFCAVERPADHPRKSEDWHPLDAFWTRLGYVKHPELTTAFSWKEIGEEKETLKPMTFWIKHL